MTQMVTSDEMVHLINAEQDKKLRELMSREDYEAFSAGVAKKIFLAKLMSLPDTEAKNHVLADFDKITADALGTAVEGISNDAT